MFLPLLLRTPLPPYVGTSGERCLRAKKTYNINRTAECGFVSTLHASAVELGMDPDDVHAALKSNSNKVAELIKLCREAVVAVLASDHSAGAAVGEEWVTREEQLRGMDTSVESVMKQGDILTPAQWMGVMSRGGWADSRAINILATLLGFPEIQIVKESSGTGNAETTGRLSEQYVQADTVVSL